MISWEIPSSQNNNPKNLNLCKRNKNKIKSISIVSRRKDIRDGRINQKIIIAEKIEIKYSSNNLNK